MKMVTRVVSAGLAAAAVVGAGVLLPAAPAAAESVTRWVDNDSPAPAGPPQCAEAAYDTIQSAVNASSPGDVVRVCPGTYVENVVVLTADLTVVSTGGSGVTTVAAPASPSPYLAALGYNHVFYIRAPEVTVGRFTIVPRGVADPDIGVNVANEGSSAFELLHSRVIGGRIGVNLGCGGYGNRVGYNAFYRQTESAINVDTCEMAPFPGSRLNQIDHNEACAPTVSGSIALGGSSDLNQIHNNRVRNISLFGTGNIVLGNTTKLPIVDNGTLNVVLFNTTDPAICP